jgi:hypothetical protein
MNMTQVLYLYLTPGTAVVIYGRFVRELRYVRLPPPQTKAHTYAGTNLDIELMCTLVA